MHFLDRVDEYSFMSPDYMAENVEGPLAYSTFHQYCYIDVGRAFAVYSVKHE
jgi:hypothetical protein